SRPRLSDRGRASAAIDRRRPSLGCRSRGRRLEGVGGPVIRLVGLYREKEYSPGRHQSNDTLLFDAVTERVRARHWPVDVGPIERRPDATLIFSMCQGRAALERLLAWERTGAQIINSPRAALNTYR